MHPEEILKSYALSLLGLPYAWGGDDSLDGFDCSGLVVELMKSVGVMKSGDDFTADGMMRKFQRSATPAFGCLAFYGDPKVGVATHVAFCLNQALVLEAGGGGKAVRTRADAVERNAFVRVRPILYRGDFIGARMPPYFWRT